MNAGPNATYVWSDSSLLLPRVVTQSGVYALKISNACTTMVATKKVRFEKCEAKFDVPSAFTPNHDGLNDVFRAHVRGQARNFMLSVYHRSGQRIFFSNDIGKGWDGTYNHSPQQPGTYVWIIHYTDPEGHARSASGTLVLIR